MSIDILSIGFLTLWLVVVIIFGYSAYWAFTIRAALQQGLYKKQALWVAVMAIYFVVLGTFLTLILSFHIFTLPTNVLGGSLIAMGFITQFLWIDYTVRVARRSDPLNRDTVHWSRLRYLWGFVTIGGAIGAFFDALTSGFSLTAPFGGILFIGAIAIILSARRSGDLTLRTHLKWMGLCIFTLWLAGQASQPLFRFISNSTLVETIIFTFVAAGAYALYRSAKSLVPVGRIEKINLIPSLQPASSFSSTTVSPP